MRVVRYVVFAAGLPLLGACSHERGAETTTTTGVSVLPAPNATAVSRIADARCAHERSCSNIGPGRHYLSIEACSQKTQANVMSDLNINDCPGGVAPKELDACVAAIEAESCGNVLDKVERITACRTSALCLK